LIHTNGTNLPYGTVSCSFLCVYFEACCGDKANYERFFCQINVVFTFLEAAVENIFVE
jgi:hypothetical protein